MVSAQSHHHMSSVQDANPGKEYTPDQVAEADQTANFEYMTPEEQERMKLRQGTDVRPDSPRACRRLYDRPERFRIAGTQGYQGHMRLVRQSLHWRKLL